METKSAATICRETATDWAREAALLDKPGEESKQAYATGAAHALYAMAEKLEERARPERAEPMQPWSPYPMCATR